MPSDDYAVWLLEEMLKIYSPTGREEKLAQFLLRELSKLGFQVKLDEVGNVIAKAGSGKPSILLCGHMDTVEGEIPVRRRLNVIFGRGAVDAKGPLAALIVAAARHQARGGKGSLTIAAVVDEEGRSRGIKHFLETHEESFDYAIFGEPGRAHGISIAYRGRALLEVTVKTTPGHSATPQLFENSIEHMCKLINELKKAIEVVDKEPFHSTTVCPTIIEGGTADNVIPAHCRALIDVRIPPKVKPMEILEKALKIAQGHQSSKVGVEVKLIDAIEGFETNEDELLVQVFKEAIQKITGRTPVLRRKTASCDANTFVASKRTPTVVYGPGNSKLDHAPNENISIPEYLQAIKVLEEVLWRLTLQG